MTNPGELISDVFSLVVTAFVVVIISVVLLGGDISKLVDYFASFMPSFVIGLLVVFFLLKALEAF